MANQVPPPIISGARAKVGFIDPATQQAEYVGIFNSVSMSVMYDIVPAYILGAYAPAALEYTGSQPVQVRASGYRAYDHGPFVDGHMPKLQDLMSTGYMVMQVLDRENGQVIGKITDCLCGGFDSAITAKQLEEMTLTYVGRFFGDESTGGDSQSDPMGVDGAASVIPNS